MILSNFEVIREAKLKPKQGDMINDAWDSLNHLLKTNPEEILQRSERGFGYKSFLNNYRHVLKAYKVPSRPDDNDEKGNRYHNYLF